MFPKLEEAERRIAMALKNAADKLDLGGLELTVMPESIVALKQLRTLILNNNRLTSFPAMVSKLTELRYIDISLNSLTLISDEIYRLFDF